MPGPETVRSEIGLRHALGAAKSHIRIQLLAEAILLALTGGATAVYRRLRHDLARGGCRAHPRLGRAGWAPPSS